MADNLTLALQLTARTAGLTSGLARGQRDVRGFAQGVRREFDALKGLVTGLPAKLAGIGAGVGAVSQLMRSARLDKDLGLIGQTAGASEAQVAKLRGELFRMQKETGRGVDNLKEGFDAAVQSGLKMGEALPVLDAVNKGMGVSTASAQQLTGSLGVAATAFQFDLSKPGLALGLLDKMVVAGRQGNAELQNLSDIFARVGVNAGASGMGFEQTLAFIEGLSQVERQPERLATLADSTLRLFTNLDYAAEAAKATGVKFFEKGGKARDPFQVLDDLRTKYRALKTDRDRALFLDKAFGKADLDTQKGLKTLFSGDALDKVKGFTAEIERASGTIQRDLTKAVDNPVDQVGRLKGALGEAGDRFAAPINESIKNLIKFSLDTQDKGGLDLSKKIEEHAKWVDEKTKPYREYAESRVGDVLSGTRGMSSAEIAGMGTAGVVVAGLATLFGTKLLGMLGGKLIGAGKNVASGEALAAATGATPVVVLNWPAGFGASSGSSATDMAAGAGAAGAVGWLARKRAELAFLGGTSLRALPMFGRGALTMAGGSVIGAGLGGWGLGSLIYKGIEGTRAADIVGAAAAGYGIPELIYKGVLGMATPAERARSAPQANAEARRRTALAVPESVREPIDRAFPLTGLGGSRLGTEIGDSAKRILDLAGNEEARRGIELSTRLTGAADTFARALAGIDLGGTLTIRIDSPTPARVTGLSANNPNMRINVDTGPTMVLPQ
jgi:TP901 family phage tail tape measure protein